MGTLNTKDAQDLLWGSVKDIAEYLGCSLRTARRYKAGITPLPACARKLLQLRYGDLAGVLGTDWEGFTAGRDGKLYAPFFRNGFSADQIKAMFFELQELSWLRREVKRLNMALDNERAKTWAEDKVHCIMRNAGTGLRAGR